MKPIVLITGASSGIGKELAECFAEGGRDLALTARNEARLLALKEILEGKHRISVRILPLDLSDPQAPDILFERLAEEGIVVDVLVNNAGFGVFGPFAETPLQGELAMIDLHVRNLTQLTKRFLPGMLERRRGGILNVASTAAFQPGPMMAVYYASKSYTLSFTEALASELRGTGVRVTALCPGPTDTEFPDRARADNAKLFAKGRLMDARAVAKAGYAGFQQGKTIVIPGLRNRLLAFSTRLAPRKAVTAIVRRLHRTR